MTYVDIAHANLKEMNMMPRRDGTGPMGEGPMTGRGFGPCNPNNQDQKQNFTRGQGRGGRSCRRMNTGFGKRFQNTFDQNSEK